MLRAFDNVMWTLLPRWMIGSRAEATTDAGDEHYVGERFEPVSTRPGDACRDGGGVARLRSSADPCIHDIDVQGSGAFVSQRLHRDGLRRRHELYLLPCRGDGRVPPACDVEVVSPLDRGHAHRAHARDTASPSSRRTVLHGDRGRTSTLPGRVSHRFGRPANSRASPTHRSGDGSGTVARSYFTEENGRLFQLPLTWYRDHGWDFSPGYEINNARFDRLMPDRCIACHANYPATKPFLEGKPVELRPGIGCERCHGPGALHVAERRAGTARDSGRMAQSCER